MRAKAGVSHLIDKDLLVDLLSRQRAVPHLEVIDDKITAGDSTRRLLAADEHVGLADGDGRRGEGAFGSPGNAVDKDLHVSSGDDREAGVDEAVLREERACLRR